MKHIEAKAKAGILMAHPTPEIMSEMSFSLKPQWFSTDAVTIKSLFYNPERDGTWSTRRVFSIEIVSGWIVALLTIFTDSLNPQTKRKGQDLVLGVYLHKSLFTRFSNVTEFSFSTILDVVINLNDIPGQDPLERLLERLVYTPTADGWVEAAMRPAMETFEVALLPDPLLRQSFSYMAIRNWKIGRILNSRHVWPISNERHLLNVLSSIDSKLSEPRSLPAVKL